MRRGAVCALTFALFLGLAAVASAVDDDAKPADPGTGTWFTRWFGSGKKAPENKPADKVAKDEKQAPSKAELLRAAAAQRGREEAALVRRQEVCLKLRTIAVQTRDEGLRRQADQLEEQAWNTYLKRTAQLAGGSAGGATDEAILDRHLGTASGHATAALGDRSSGSSANERAATRGEAP
jgi:hypothetical protein